MEPAKPSAIRLLLVDDHNVVRIGFAAVLGFDRRFTVVAQAEDGEQAVAAFNKHLPDVTLMDVRMPKLDGIEATRRIRAIHPKARLLMLTTFDTQEDVRSAIDAGARGYLLKTAGPDELVEAILAVHENHHWFPPALHKHPARARIEAPLSPRQREVLELVAKGFSNKEIASSLGFTEDGTKSHLKAIFGKLGVKDRTQAIVAGMRRGLLRLS